MYTFKKGPTDPDFDDSTLVYKFEDRGITLPEMFEHFGNFLKGCGFCIDGKVLDLVDEYPTDNSDDILIEVEDSNISFTLKKDQFIKLADMANKSNMTLNHFINQTLSNYLDKVEKEEEDA